MAEDKKQPNEEITKAGAVELEEDQLKEVSGGSVPLEAAIKFSPGAQPAIKFTPGIQPAIKFTT